MTPELPDIEYRFRVLINGRREALFSTAKDAYTWISTCSSADTVTLAIEVVGQDAAMRMLWAIVSKAAAMAEAATETPKPKRKRRTKAELAAARALTPDETIAPA